MRPKRVTTPQPKSPEKALSSLMALCARAERSSGDAHRLMSRWGIERGDQEAILTRLIKERFIDDQRYAAAFVREKTRLNGWGAYKIRAALSQKGVAESIIAEQLEQLDNEDTRNRLEELIAKRSRSVKYNSKYHLRDKLIRYGASLGYNFATVSEVVSTTLSQMKFDEESEEELF